MDRRVSGPTPLISRTGLKLRPARAVPRQPTEGQAQLQYFTQLLDIDTICLNALRNLRAEDKENTKWMAALQEDEWMFKCAVPITVKY
jgi:hypothetical protein